MRILAITSRRKGVKQGDPLSPLLFNIIVDMLAILISRVKENGQISGMVLHLVDDELLVLQYADDMIIFMENNLDQAVNMKLLLCAFEQLSELKINFHRSELFCFGEAKNQQSIYSQIFGCGMGTFPFRYLGILMHFRRVKNADWKEVEERFQKKLCAWKGKMLSVGTSMYKTNVC